MQHCLAGILNRGQERGIFLVNVTQCAVGSVDANRYVTGAGLTRIGVEPSLDITLEGCGDQVDGLGRNAS